MNSLFAQLYLAVSNQIKQAVPEIKYIDQDLGQLEYYKDRPAVDFPCVLIEFPTASFQEEGQHTQWANVSVQIRLGFEPWSSANADAPPEVKENALEYYELEHKLFMALQHFDADGLIQPMIRMSAATERREDVYRVRELIFSTATEDDSVQIPARKKSANLELTSD